MDVVGFERYMVRGKQEEDGGEEGLMVCYPVVQVRRLGRLP